MAGRGPSDADHIHNRITVLRAERGLTRKELAEAVQVHYRTVGYLERGQYAPSLALAFRIARFFDLPLEAVFSDRPFEHLSTQVYPDAGAQAEGTAPTSAQT